MGKFHYEQRIAHEGFLQTTVPGAPPPSSTQIATRLFTDTIVRSVHQPILICEVDESVSPPVDNWWAGTNVTFTVRFDASGSSSAGSGPFSATVLGNLVLYPRLVPANTGYDLHYIIWEPLDGPLKLTTARKGDGVHFPRIIESLWCTDHNAVFSNPGGLYSVNFWHRWTSLAIWASDSP